VARGRSLTVLAYRESVLGVLGAGAGGTLAHRQRSMPRGRSRFQGEDGRPAPSPGPLDNDVGKHQPSSEGKPWNGLARKHR